MRLILISLLMFSLAFSAFSTSTKTISTEQDKGNGKLNSCFAPFGQCLTAACQQRGGQAEITDNETAYVVTCNFSDDTGDSVMDMALYSSSRGDVYQCKQNLDTCAINTTVQNGCTPSVILGLLVFLAFLRIK